MSEDLLHHKAMDEKGMIPKVPPRTDTSEETRLEVKKIVAKATEKKENTYTTDQY